LAVAQMSTPWRFTSKRPARGDRDMPKIQIRDNTEVSYRDSGTEQFFVFFYGRLLSPDVLRRCISLTRVLCLIVPLVATIAKAQELPDATANATRPASGWWSPAKAESAPEPQLAISMAELTHFEASDSFRTFPAQRTTYRVTEPMDVQIASLQYIAARDARPSLLADGVSLPPGSFPSLLQTRYAIWESSLADSRSLVDVNGMSVYPLFQINYAGWHLPVTLYISSLRGSDAR
jgi:hypothetical protein